MDPENYLATINVALPDEEKIKIVSWRRDEQPGIDISHFLFEAIVDGRIVAEHRFSTSAINELSKEGVANAYWAILIALTRRGVKQLAGAV